MSQIDKNIPFPTARNVRGSLSDSPAATQFHVEQVEPHVSPAELPAAQRRGRPPKLPPQDAAQANKPTEFGFRKSPKKRFRGTPPPSVIDLATLPATSFLSEHEVAAILRRPKVSLEYWRRKVPDHPLKWRRIAGRVLYEVASLRELLKGGDRGDT